ncbi:recombinase family protein [Clostridium sp. FAM 1755]|uniref:recombinase family protein n=1 Tax=Clostridium TaxID=1485 RepID=UPI0038F75EBC
MKKAGMGVGSKFEPLFPSALGYIKFYYIFIVEGDVHMLYFAYHRTSTKEQHLDRGIHEINQFIEKENIELVNEIYNDQQTGKNFDRPSYDKMISDINLIKKVNPNEQIALILTELDRLGRNKQLILKEIRKMQDNGIRLMVLEIPTTLIELPKDSSIATMIMETINNMLIEMYASFAQAELEKKEKRQREGIAAKKARGEWEDYGRPRVLNFDKFCKEYKRVLNGDIKPVECMKLLEITKPTYYRYRKEYEESKLV